MHRFQLRNLTQPLPQKITLTYCDSFTCRLRGLMFQKRIGPQEGLLLVEHTESRINTAIHTLFMMIDLAVIWINNELIVVDKKIALPWKFMYMPRSPARYVLETNVENLQHFSLGDQLSFE